MSKRKTTEQFIRESEEIHNGKYDYSKVNYVNAFTKVLIICPIHGEFLQPPHDHLKGCGCDKCRADNVGNRRRLNTNLFIERARKIHGNKYDYSKVNYTDSHDTVKIICPKHGEFELMAYAHLNGQGCKKCKMSTLENEVFQLLTREGIDFKYDVRDLKFLSGLTLDFYLPKYNIAVECQGIQHFEDSRMLKCEKVIERDKLKKKLCDEHGIKLLYYSNLGIEYPYNVFEDKEKLFEEVKKV